MPRSDKLNKLSKEYVLSLPKIISPEGCWLFQGRLTNEGYGSIQFNYFGRTTIKLHRLVAHIWHKLDINNDKQLACHIIECKYKHCFNPDHIYIGNNKSNNEDCVSAGKHKSAIKTHCNNGHILDGTFYDKGKKLYRYCKTCRRERKKLKTRHI